MDEDYIFDCRTVSFEELFAGKIKALVERAAARDLYDVWKLPDRAVEYDQSKLKRNLLLFGLTIDSDWRKKDLATIDQIDQTMLDEQLAPLLREAETLDLSSMKRGVKTLLTTLLKYDEQEQMFMSKFYDDGRYEPELIFTDKVQIENLKRHPALLWKLQNHRKYLGL